MAINKKFVNPVEILLKDRIDILVENIVLHFQVLVLKINIFMIKKLQKNIKKSKFSKCYKKLKNDQNP